MADRKIDIIINADDLATKEIKKLEKNIWKLDWTFKKMWQQVWKAWKAVKENMWKIVVGFGAAWAAVVATWKQFLDLGTNIELTQKKANTVFGEYIKDVEKFADETWKAMWLSKNEFLSAAAGIQDLLIPMWFARDEATKLTTDTIALSWALAEWSWGARTATEVADILAKAYLWETEQLKWLGIALNAEIINQRVAENATKWLKWATEEQSRAMAIQQLILEKSTDAQEAYKNGAGSLARKQAELSATIKNTRDTIAVALIPVMNDFIKSLTPVIEKVAENITQWAKNKENIENLKDSIVTATKVFVNIWKIIWLVAKIIHWFWKILWEIAYDIYKFAQDTIKIFEFLWKDIEKTFISTNSKAEWWGWNMLDMFINWIKPKIPLLETTVSSISTTISDYLWFHSPTKKGATSDSDKWMPNFIKMLKQWLDNWKSDIERASSRISSAIWDAFEKEDLEEFLNSIKNSSESAFRSIWSDIDAQKWNLRGLINEYKWLNDQIDNINNAISSIELEWTTQVAQRTIEIEKELANLSKTIKEWVDDSIDRKRLEEKQKQLELELQLAKANTTQEEIEKVRIENAKTETQKILDRINARIKEQEEEKARILELQELKKQELLSEAEVYKNLIEQKKKLDEQYFEIFQNNITRQKSEIDIAIEKMRRLIELSRKANIWGFTSWVDWARADGWPVQAWKTFLVWERWPELFTPRSSWMITSNENLRWWWDININMWGVTVTNEADENRLVEKLTRQIQLQKLWIS